MTIEELEQIAKSVQQENAKYDYEVNVCMDLACASQGAGALKDALVKAAEAVGQEGAGAPHRLHGAVLAWAAGARGSRRDALPPREGGERRGDREQPGRRAGAGVAVRPERALRQAGARGAGECRLHRSGKDRRLHCARRLQGAADGADRDDAERRGSPHHGERPARARRRRLSHGPEVGHGGQGRGRREIRGVQRRRRRPRRIHGSQRDGRRSASRDRGHGDCRLRGGREQRIHLCARGVSGGRRRG